MPDKRERPDLKSLSGEVDRLLGQLNPALRRPARSSTGAQTAGAPTPGPTGVGTRPAAAFPGPRHARRALPLAGTAGPAAPLSPRISLPSRHGVWLRTALGVLLAGALTQWPYASCGLPLAAYLAAVVVVLVAAVWAGQASWRRRMPAAHVVAVGTLLAGATLLLFQLLPRVGYAAVHLGWRCGG